MTLDIPTATCDWPTDPACFEDDWDELDDTIKARALQLASATLRRLTGYRVGGCPLTVRPAVRSCWDTSIQSYYDMLAPGGVGVSGFWPVNWGGVWVNWCGHRYNCDCPVNRCQVRLPSPVGRVDEVKLNGAVVTDWRLLADGILIWTGTGDCPWPTCQDLTLPDTEDGTFSVTYLNSYPVDTIGAYAAGIMTMEFAKACGGDGTCRLPSSVSRVTRAGVSFEVVSGAFADGVTGIREVDTFIGMWNPAKKRQPSTVWSPDLD